jgi:hypothetical protein
MDFFFEIRLQSIVLGAILSCSAGLQFSIGFTLVRIFLANFPAENRVTGGLGLDRRQKAALGTDTPPCPRKIRLNKRALGLGLAFCEPASFPAVTLQLPLPASYKTS